MGGDPRGRHRLSRAGGRSGSSRSAPAAAANPARTARRSSSRWTRSPQASRASCSSSCRCRARAGPRRYGPRSHRKKASNGVASRSVAAFERWLVRASSGGSGRQDPRHSARWSVRWHLSSASKATVPSSGGPTAGDSTPLVVALPLRSVELATKEPAQALRERTDSCTVPAAGVVAEAMVALVLASAYREKPRGDHLGDALAALRAYEERRRMACSRSWATSRSGPSSSSISDVGSTATARTARAPSPPTRSPRRPPPSTPSSSTLTTPRSRRCVRGWPVVPRTRWPPKARRARRGPRGGHRGRLRGAERLPQDARHARVGTLAGARRASIPRSLRGR